MRVAIEKWRQRWKKTQRFVRRERKNPHLRELWDTTKRAVIVLIMESILLLLLTYLVSWDLLDVKTAVSVVIPDMAVAVVLYYILGGHRRERLDEVINLMEGCEKFSHLAVYTYLWLGIEINYVKNQTTKQAYKAPSFIENIIDQGIMQRIPCKNRKDMLNKFRKAGVHLNERDALAKDLQTKDSQKSLYT